MAFQPTPNAFGAAELHVRCGSNEKEEKMRHPQLVAMMLMFGLCGGVGTGISQNTSTADLKRVSTLRQTVYLDRTRNHDLMRQIEEKLGRPFSERQKELFKQASRESVPVQNKYQTEFVGRLHEITGLSEQEIRRIVLGVGETKEHLDSIAIPEMERLLGRQISEDELEEIMKADLHKKENIEPALQKQARQISEFTGLPADEIQGMLFITYPVEVKARIGDAPIRRQLIRE